MSRLKCLSSNSKDGSEDNQNGNADLKEANGTNTINVKVNYLASVVCQIP